MHHESTFSECLESVVKQSNTQLIAKHQGEFSQDFVYELAYQIEQRLLEGGEAKSVVKKVFFILIEGLQNIRIHSLKKENVSELSFFILSQNTDEFTFFFSNVIDLKAKKFIESSTALINSKTDVELKAYYMAQLANGQMSEKGGGGLGLITLRLKTDKPLETNIIAIGDDTYLYTLRIVVDRKK